MSANVTTPTLDAQKLYLTEAPAKFDIQVRCQQSNQQCNLVQMELLAALRDRKTEFNTALRKFSGKDSAYLAASGMPAVTSLSQNLDQFEDGAGASASSATNLFLMLVAGMAMTTLGFVTFHKLTKRSRQELSREDEAMSALLAWAVGTWFKMYGCFRSFEESSAWEGISRD